MRHSSQGPTTVSKKKMQLKDLGPKAAWENAGDEVTYFWGIKELENYSIKFSIFMHLAGGGWHGKQVEVGEELEGPDSFILQVQLDRLAD